ncbi:hypothetical protein ACFXKD_00590 [Nocardiopsis aegyptia]|uniref:hypothetical protein n=1 Tax=Nocardiopsis aegyptia TaxID=220378 RepID=UPI00366EDCD6
MPRPWKRPDIPPGPLGELNRALHELHHRAGWLSSREIRRALDAKGVPMSHTKVHDTLSKPVLPTKGAVEMISEGLAEKVCGADIEAEINRVLGLWQDASLDNPGSSPAPPQDPKVEPPLSDEPPPAEKSEENRQPHHQDTTDQLWLDETENRDLHPHQQRRHRRQSIAMEKSW